MEDFSAPSFSLGLDLDIADITTEDEDEEEEGRNRPSIQSSEKWMDEEKRLCKPSIQELEDFDMKNIVEQHQQEDPDPPMRVLKRLRRGPLPSPIATDGPSCLPVDEFDLINGSHLNICDEIEEFSSPEKEAQRGADDYPSTQSQITCNSTKFSLLHRGYLRDKSEGKRVATKVAPVSTGASTSSGLEASNVKYPFPRLTISPIRKINLLDTDSDDSPTNKGVYKKNEETNVPLKKGKWFCEKSSACEGKKDSSTSKCQKETFWKDFSPKKNINFETPALDEFCEEYFTSKRGQNVNRMKEETNSSVLSSSRGVYNNDIIRGYDDLDSSKNISGNVCVDLDLSSPHPPAYRYFYNTDPKIRALVRQRLPHFVPLGNKKNGEAREFGDITIDYMNQFNPTYSTGKARVVSEKVSRSNSSKNQNKQRRNNAIESTGSWVKPKSKDDIPKNAGKRRVKADVLQSGQWFTDQDGRKVYVSKDGEQSTGRVAYMKYKKETRGLRKPNVKAAAKRNRKSKR